MWGRRCIGWNEPRRREGREDEEAFFFAFVAPSRLVSKNLERFMNTIDWHGFTGYVLENEHMRVVIVPALGAKIVSLVDKAANHEWLAPPTNAVRAREYGDTFTDHDMAGWDEMFPTIVACPSPRDPSVMLPDHGEVWGLPWEIMAADDRKVALNVEGQSLPYTLERVALLYPGTSTLHLIYHLKNHSNMPLPFLWTAHPLFNGNEYTRIELPSHISHVVNVVDHPVWGMPNRVLDYPFTPGISQYLNRVGDPSRRDYRKFYVLPGVRTQTAALVQENISCRLRLTWDILTVRYLGVWVDEGTYSRGTTVAFEPSSGYYDSLALAMENQRATVILPGEVKTWWLTVECGQA
jgi:galactose mutarotase-like enzyme